MSETRPDFPVCLLPGVSISQAEQNISAAGVCVTVYFRFEEPREDGVTWASWGSDSRRAGPVRHWADDVLIRTDADPELCAEGRRVAIRLWGWCPSESDAGGVL